MVWSLERATFRALSGRGLEPYSLWLLALGLPALAVFWNLRRDESAEAWVAWLAVAMAAGWTIPPETLGRAIVDIGKLRSSLADIIPIIPQVARHLPSMLLVAYPILPQLLPHVGTVAPHLHVLLPHAEFLTRIIPKISSRIDELIPLLEKIGPLFASLTPEHLVKLELIMDDVVEKLDLLQPHLEKLAPIMGDGILVADKMMPHIEAVLPYMDALEKDLNWLLPFAEIEGVEELLPLLDKIAPRIGEIQPFAEAIAPHIHKLKPHLPYIVNNLDVLMDQVNEDVIQNLDPLLFWCGRLLPMADSMGILRSKRLLRAFMPMAKYLPPVPVQRTHRKHAGSVENEGHEWWRLSSFDRTVTIPHAKNLGDTVYFVMNVDKKYAGEFRYRHARELHQHLRAAQLLNDEHVPVFPPRHVFTLTAAQLEERRMRLELWIVHILSDPEICANDAFIHFVRVHRRWADAELLPGLKSPLMM